MKNFNYKNLLSRVPDAERAKKGYEILSNYLRQRNGKVPSVKLLEQLGILFSAAPWVIEVLKNHPEFWGVLLEEKKKDNKSNQVRLFKEIEILLSHEEYEKALGKIRTYKLGEMIRITFEDLGYPGRLREVVDELSNLAEVSIEAVVKVCRNRMIKRVGVPYFLDSDDRVSEAGLCVIGLGKLGGRELNYSSDIDILFIYSGEGAVFKDKPPTREDLQREVFSGSNHKYFNRLAADIVNEISNLSPDGVLYRVDLRLRPDGNKGPLARSLASYEDYYSQMGQTWERMMLIKARHIAGDRSLSNEFLETINSFRYPRYISDKILEEIGHVKRRIETEVLKSDAYERNIKLGRGGIREIEFIVQGLQLLHAGKQPFLQCNNTLEALKKLKTYEVLPYEDAEKLEDAYCFFRDIEHKLQMEYCMQTHSLPSDESSRIRLVRILGFRDVEEFDQKLEALRSAVRKCYNDFIKISDNDREERLPDLTDDNEENWKKMLVRYGFKDPEKSFKLLKVFVFGPGYVHISENTINHAMRIIPIILSLCPNQKMGSRQDSKELLIGKDSANELRFLSDPDRVLARLDSYVNAYGARKTLLETWNSNPKLLQLLLWLFDRSEYLAEILIRVPDLVDDIEQTGQLLLTKRIPDYLKELEAGKDEEDQMCWLRRYYQAEVLRIGLKDILGLANSEMIMEELTDLAEAFLIYSLDVVKRSSEITDAPFAIIGLGKLGGKELVYGSDLDLIFVTSNKEKNPAGLKKLVIPLIELISAHTELGQCFIIDTRLRPDGEKGLLVNTLSAYENYYWTRSMLWEIQALTRARFIAGNERIGQDFIKKIQKIINFKNESAKPSAFSTNWKMQIASMRSRIEKERTPHGHSQLAFKTGAGGLMDVEFIAQAICLENGWHIPNTIKVLTEAQRTNKISSSFATNIIENYRYLQRLELILRRWSFAGESVLPADPAPLYRVAVRCGYNNSQDFLMDLEKKRAIIRKCFDEFFGLSKS